MENKIIPEVVCPPIFRKQMEEALRRIEVEFVSNVYPVHEDRERR